MTIFNEDVTSNLALTQGNALVWEDSLTSALALVTVALIVFPEGVSSLLTLVDALTDEVSSGETSPLSLTQSASDQCIFNNSSSNALALTQDLVLWVVHPTKPINPCDATYLTTDNIDLKRTVTWTYPYTSPSQTVTIRAPEFKDSRAIDTGTVARKNRGGEYDVVRPDSWPQVELLTLHFVGLTQALKDAMVQFLSDSAGFEVGYLDHEGIQWRGVIVTPTSDAVKPMRDCSWEIGIEFRGVKA